MCANDNVRRMGILEDMTIEEVRSFGPEVVMIPIGSTEPHGPHLCYCVDTLNAKVKAEAATVKANERGAKVLCYPTLPISLNVNFTGFPFALSMRVETFMQMLRDLCEHIEKEGVRKIVILNGHGGNTDVIAAFLRSWAHRGIAGTAGAENRAFVCNAHCYFPEAREVIENPSIHGGESEVLETTLHESKFVLEEKLDNFKTQEPGIKSLGGSNVAWVRPWHMYLPASAAGETRGLDMSKAEKFASLNIKGLADLLVELAQMPWSNNFPYV